MTLYAGWRTIQRCPPPGNLGFGSEPTFGIFLVLAALSLIFIYKLAPETKGRQLQSIRRYWFNGGRWPERAETRT
jgi:hypothetical protein